MYRNRFGRPRSLISSGGLADSASADTSVARRARPRRPASRETRASVAAAPPSPPLKKYQPISVFHTGCLITGRP